MPPSTDNILYLGTDPSNCPLKGNLVHIPVIEIEPLPKDAPHILLAKKAFRSFTHIVFTSRNGVRLFFSRFAGLSLDGKCLLSVGAITTRALHERGCRQVLTPSEACQEGIIALLEGDDLSGAHVLLPSSARARPLLCEYLQSRGTPFTFCPLYRPRPRVLDPLPDLLEFDSLVFTSPSTVQAFQCTFTELPSHLSIYAQGEVTKEEIQKLYKKVAVTILAMNSQ